MNNQTKKVITLFSNKSEQEILSFDKGGIIGDKHYDKDPIRSVLIASTHSYQLAKDDNIELNSGDLGENIVVDFNPYKLAPQTKIEIGGVILEITQMSTLCKSLTKLDSRLPKLLKNDRGIFAKVIKSGKIKKGDIINIL